MRMNDIILIIDRNGNFVPIDLRNTGHIYTEGMGVSGKTLNDAYNVDDAALFLKAVQKSLRSHKTVTVEYNVADDKEARWFETVVLPMTEDLALFVARDITESKMALSKLAAESAILQEMITSLKIRINRMEEISKSLEDTMLSNIRTFVEPHIKNLKTTRLDHLQMTYIELIESNLSKLTSPLIHDTRQFNLTPMEMQVASLIKEGRTTQDIAGVLKTSKIAIDKHRYSIRKKLGLNNKKENLQSFLLSIA